MEQQTFRCCTSGHTTLSHPWNSCSTSSPFTYYLWKMQYSDFRSITHNKSLLQFIWQRIATIKQRVIAAVKARPQRMRHVLERHCCLVLFGKHKRAAWGHVRSPIPTPWPPLCRLANSNAGGGVTGRNGHGQWLEKWKRLPEKEWQERGQTRGIHNSPKNEFYIRGHWVHQASMVLKIPFLGSGYHIKQ